MTASQFMGSVRRRARAAGPPAPLPAEAWPPECWKSPGKPRPPARIERRAGPCAEPLEPRTLLATFTVTTPADAGPGSLRQAILDANAAEGADEIHFALPGTAGTVHTIRPLSKFPDITGPTTLDATTQPGYAGSPVIELDGSAAGAEADGMTVRARHSQLRGLVINRFSRHGIVIDAPPTTARPPGFMSVDGCRIGTDAGGNVAQPNGGAGIVVKSVITLIGGSGVGQRNLISGNRLAGVWASAPSVPGRDSVAIKGNYIGTNAAGDAAMPNGTFGVLVDAGAPFVRYNLISGNTVSGVHAIGATASPSISDNLIGTDAGGRYSVANGARSEVPLQGGVTVAGGAAPAITRNIISGNFGAGVAAEGSKPSIGGNKIGTDPTASLAVPNRGEGIRISGGTDFRISSNTISANTGDGVRLTAVMGASQRPNVVGGNTIGTNATRSMVLGNGGNGISVLRCSNIDIGLRPDGSTFIPPFGLISGNAGRGVYIEGDTARRGPAGIYVVRNEIGFSRSSAAGPSNAGSGIYLAAVEGAVIESNAIAGNSGDGITLAELVSVPSTANVIRSNTIGIGPAWIGPVGNLGAGVSVRGASAENRITGNLIADNTGPGIDLGGDGVTPNDRLDVDAGANRLQNFPVVTGVSPYVPGVPREILFTLDAAPNTTYVVEVFGSLVPDPRGYGRAMISFGSTTVRTDANGHVEGSTQAYPVPGRVWFTATATDGRGNTSELSPAFAYRRPRDSFRPPARRSAVLVPVVSLGRTVVRRDAPVGRELLG